MLFERVKAMYAVAVLSLAVILFSPDMLLRGIAAILLLLGALPMFKVIKREVAKNALIGFHRNLSGEETRRSATIHPTSEDR